MTENASSAQINAIIKAKLHDKPWELSKQEAWKILNDKFGDSEDSKPQKSHQNGSNDSRNATMYISYAKDIFCNLNEHKTDLETSQAEMMAQAINLVKQAQAAFE